MSAERMIVGWVTILVLGCAAGTTDDFFKVGELPEDADSDADSSASSSTSSGGVLNVSSGDDGGETASGEVATSAADSGGESSATTTTGSSGDGAAGGGMGGAAQANSVGGETSTTGDGGSGGSGDSAGGSGGSGGSAGGVGSGGSGGSDQPEIYVHVFDEEEDCVTAQCPENAPYLVACNVTFTSFNEEYYCLAVEEDRNVFIKSGTTCGATGSSVAAGSTITCSSEPLDHDITTEECVTNKDDRELVSDRCDCEGAARYIDGC